MVCRGRWLFTTLLWLAAPTWLGPAARAQSQPAADSERFQIVCRHLVRNDSDAALRNIRIYLAVPDSGPAQEVTALTIERDGRPTPALTTKDRWGTSVATFILDQLDPGAEATVGFTCEVILHPPPRFTIDAATTGALGDIPPEIRRRYTDESDPIYSLADPELRRLAAELCAETEHPAERLRRIHNHLAERFSYDRDGRWDPAATVLARGTGSCSELSFVLAALCRAVGLPTRLVGGTRCRAADEFPYQDRVYHRWTEVYLPPHGWVPVDVTADLGRPAKQDYLGSYRSRTLILSRAGGRSDLLGLQYHSANSHTGRLTRERVYTWQRREGEPDSAAAPLY